MKGAEKIFIHGEEIARAKDVAQSKQEVLNTLFQEDANTRNELNSRIDGIPVIYPQELVDNGFDYTYSDPSAESKVTVSVEPYGSGLGFTLQEDGWYQADNIGVDNSYAMAKILFNNISDINQTVVLDISQTAEQGYDYFVVSVLNAPLDDGLEDSSNVQDIFSNMGEFDIGVLFDVPAGESYKIIKYRKDGSGNAPNERARFKARWEAPVVTERRHMATEENVENKIKQAVSTVYKYKGSVANEASLPTTDNEVGDVYNCEDTGNNFAWTGTVWDKLAGTIDLSNYYTKSQSDASAAAIADEKIAAIPVNDLLHYKGHVETVEDLPSTGQASGVMTTNNYSNASLPHFKTDMFTCPLTESGFYGTIKNALNYYLVEVSHTSPYADMNNQCFGFATNYPEMIKGISIYQNSNKRESFAYLIEYDENKPVYYMGACGSDGGSYDNGTFTKITENGSTRLSNSAITSLQLVTETSLFYKSSINYSTGGGRIDATYGIFLFTNIPQLKFIANSSLPFAPSGMFESLSTNDLDGNVYYYNDGMILFRSDENEYARFLFNESLAKVNDIATVGENKDIYRCNDIPQWEHWSQGVSKEYVDSIVGGVNTELENIINGE